MTTSNSFRTGTDRELRGNLHIHTERSDGTLPLEKVAKIARQVGLDFIGVTDHFAACQPGYYLDNLLILEGTELNRDHSHYLAFNCAMDPSPRQRDGALVAAEVKEKGGLGIIAHPFERGSPLVSKGKCYPWLNWETEDFQGIEVWNLTSQWRDSARSPWQSIGQWLFCRYRPFARGACPSSLSKWDALCQKRHVTALAGSDLHAPRFKILGAQLKVLDYPVLLAAVNTYCRADVSGEGEKDGTNLIAALEKGRCWLTYDRLGLGRGFLFWAEADGKQAEMGETLCRNEKRTWLHIKLPGPAEIQLMRNGAPVFQKQGFAWDQQITLPGVYRVEARRRGIPWIYSNPVYIK